MNEKKFEAFSIKTVIKDNISPKTPGFANHIFDEEDDQVEEEMYTSEKIEYFKKIAFEEGYLKGKSEINQQKIQREEILKQAITNLIDKFTDIEPQIIQTSQKNTELMINIALKAAEKIVNDLLDKNASTLIKGTVEKALKMLKKEPSLTIYVNPSLEQEISSIVEDFKSKINFKGDIIVTSTPQLHEINCLIEWQDGMIENDNKLIWETLKNIIPTNHVIDSNQQNKID